MSFKRQIERLPTPHPSDCFSRWEQTDLDPDLMTHKPLYSDIVKIPIYFFKS